MPVIPTIVRIEPFDDEQHEIELDHIDLDLCDMVFPNSLVREAKGILGLATPENGALQVARRAQSVALISRIEEAFRKSYRPTKTLRDPAVYLRFNREQLCEGKMSEQPKLGNFEAHPDLILFGFFWNDYSTITPWTI